MPTGTGKSLVIAEFIRMVLNSKPSARVICLAHVRELLSQNYDEFIGQFGAFANAGIYSAGLNSRDTDCAITFAGIQSVYDKAEEIGWQDVAIVDEVHLLPKTGEGRYLTYLSALRNINPDLVLVGLTATPYRLGSGLLYMGDDALFSGVAYAVSLDRLLEEGWLAPLVGKLPVLGVIDTSDIGTAEGDFKKDELEDAALRSDIAGAVDEICRLGAERKSWLIFATGVAHAGAVFRLIEARGVTVDIVTGDTPKDLRDERIAAFKSGALRCLVNVGVLTTGFNAPNVDLIGMLRPTKSAGLYVQIAGRGMRLSPATGKANCLYLDFGGNIARHGPVNRVRVGQPRERDEKGDAPSKLCPECGTYVTANARVCETKPVNEGCGYEFPVVEKPPHAPTATELAPIATRGPEPINTFDVKMVEYHKHIKRGLDSEGNPPTLRVEYYCGVLGVDRHVEWICLEHEGFARKKAVKWWQERSGAADMELSKGLRENGAPYSIDEALLYKERLRIPKQIRVQREGKWERIVGYVWYQPGEEPNFHDAKEAKFQQLVQDFKDGGSDGPTQLVAFDESETPF